MITSPPRSANGEGPRDGAGTGSPGTGTATPGNGTSGTGTATPGTGTRTRGNGSTTPRRPSEATPYVDLTRAEWSDLRDKTPLPLTADEVERLRGLGDVIDLDEVRDVYLPLSRLLNLYVQATSGLRGALNTFLGENAEQRGTPFVIGVAGSVAVGKSTVSRLLQALLARWPEHPRVELVTTDAFLYPMEELKARGLMARKGFPESYDRRALTRFVADIKAGKEEVTAPVYSHLIYDRVPGERLVVRRPDILIVEGLNVLQPALPGKDGRTRVGLADYFDFSVYVDARPEDIERWYLNRFRKLRDTAFQNPSSYFQRYTQVSEEEALDYARTMWRTINKVNLLENVAPTRGRATLVVRKGPDHKVQRLSLRKL